MSKTCSICGQGLAANPLSGPAHARKHRNEFREIVGRRPRSYDEVREFFNTDYVPEDSGFETLGDFA